MNKEYKAFKQGYKVVADCYSDQSNPFSPITQLVEYQSFNSGKLKARIDQEKEFKHRTEGRIQ